MPRKPCAIPECTNQSISFHLCRRHGDAWEKGDPDTLLPMAEFLMPLRKQCRKEGAKLTAREVIEMRALFALGSANQTKLARLYSVSRAVVSDIINRRTWRTENNAEETNG